MDEKHLSESDICDKFIRPAMEAAGWNGMDQIYREFPLCAGRVVVRGQKAYRDKTTVVRADYALFHKPNIPLAVVEAKDNNHALGAGMAQAINYAGLLGVPFSFSSNGDGFVFRDATMATGMLEQTIALAEFPSPAELWRRYCTWKGWTPEVERIAGFYYSHSKTPRYYQINAINRTVEAIAGGQDRVLLCNAAIGAKPRFGSGPWVDDCKTGEVEVRHVARRDSVAEFQRNSRDHEVHRRTVAACELSRPNGSPFVERQHMARVGDAKCVEPGAQDRSLLGIPGLLHQCAAFDLHDRQRGQIEGTCRVGLRPGADLGILVVRLLPQLRDDVGVQDDHVESELDVTEFDIHARDLMDLVGHFRKLLHQRE